MAIKKVIGFFKTGSGKISLVFIFVPVVIIFFLIFIAKPVDFPTKIMVRINNGLSVSSAASILKESHVIDSPIFFRVLVRLIGGGHGVLAGGYYFDKPESIFTVSRRLSKGELGLTPIRVVIPEGLSSKEIAATLAKNLPAFDENSFLKLAGKKEGYLFPDTYNLLPDIQPEEIIALMERNFDQKIASLEIERAAFGRPLKDVITMASILEGEARLLETRRIVAGILWKRLDGGMPLQVDTVFEYINGKNTATLSLDDLKIDSPYNTYLYKGLPPTPISNPGLDAILAAITPVKTKYFYFLTDKNGVMHYAATYEEHLVNKKKYLP